MREVGGRRRGGGLLLEGGKICNKKNESFCFQGNRDPQITDEVFADRPRQSVYHTSCSIL